MATGQKLAGYKLPTKPEQSGGKLAQGFITPSQNKTPQVHSIPPKRVLPIIFIPGIMGSNLRMSAERQASLGKKNNIAWRPDNLFETVPMKEDSAAERQLRFDPSQTELDTYDPKINITGNPIETSNIRNKAAHFSSQYGGSWRRIDGPLLQSDRPGTSDAKTRDEKARERGWGEVFFGSYEKILSECEVRLNGVFSDQFKDGYLMRSIVNVNPSQWEAHPGSSMTKMDEASLRNAVKGCWFPVHAMGYNWLQGNMDSGIETAERITALMKKYQSQGYQCEKVILITHSMGGLVARAIIHPEMGKIGDQVLGVIHGVMPAIGAGTAYKRMRCGFEGDDTSARILGATGPHVTAVLGNSQGGLELLPSQEYGNNWLQVTRGSEVIKSFPQKGDPYEEIYKASDKWYGLLRKNWLNPANLPGRNLRRTFHLIDEAKRFHNQIVETYHDQSYAHYGADAKGLAWHKVIWKIEGDVVSDDVTSLEIASDDEKGGLDLRNSSASSKKTEKKILLKTHLQPPAEPGDQTVPTYSADAQLRSGKFKGVFRQTGYEHQASYSNESVIAATIYCLYRIISTMRWSK
ncbi:pimeloyl-ACP methyl ester carboxylesterase [Massilia sp. UYP11]|uniref:esterase/lipase family protein n=1 Tax=Massilia sp. UYP11 TaxID=1756385 RepID=UPI003D23A6DA